MPFQTVSIPIKKDAQAVLPGHPSRSARGRVIAALLAAGCVVGPATAQDLKYPPQRAYLMERDAEVALARTAAPEHITKGATIQVLTPQGYEVVVKGDNGFVCMVMRGWANSGTYTPAQFRKLAYDASIRAPVCFTPGAVRVILPYAQMKDTLGIQGKTPDEIAEAIQLAYSTGKLPPRDEVTFAYMWSAHQHLNNGPDSEGKSLEHGWYPHMMIYAPYYRNEMLGSNAFGAMPIVGDDAGTPFAVIYVPLDPKLAVTGEPR